MYKNQLNQRIIALILLFSSCFFSKTAIGQHADTEFDLAAGYKLNQATHFYVGTSYAAAIRSMEYVPPTPAQPTLILFGLSCRSISNQNF